MGTTGAEPHAEGDGAARPAGRPPVPALGGSGAGAVGVAAGGRVRRSFVIPSDFNAANDVQQQVMDDVAAGGFDPDSVFAIRISLEEAIVNAIKHGNGYDAGKRVWVESSVGPGVAEITVEDEGPGFARACVPDPTAEENLCRPSGRGILLIESYMTDVRYEAGGRRLRMVKRADPAGPTG